MHLLNKQPPSLATRRGLLSVGCHFACFCSRIVRSHLLFVYHALLLFSYQTLPVLCLGVIACVIGEADAPRLVEAQEVVAESAVRDADAPAFEGFAAVFSVVGVLHAAHVEAGAEDEVGTSVRQDSSMLPK